MEKTFYLAFTWRYAYTFANMRNTVLKARKVKIKGSAFWQVSIPDPTGSRMKRKTFSDRASAETFVEAAKVQRDNFGAAAFSMSDALRADAIRASEILDGTGATLSDAARSFRDAWQASHSGRPIKDAVEAFLAEREGMSADYLNTLRPRLAHFTASAQGLTTANIGPDDISAFLGTLEVAPRTKSHYRTHLTALFRFFVARDWCKKNPVDAVAVPKTIDAEPEILSPADAQAILNACHRAILPGVVIALFCGLRQSEIEKLQWPAINLAEAIITIGASIAKTNSRRVVTIPQAAKAWLAPHARKTGNVWPDGEEARNLWNLARITAGYGPFYSTRASVNAAQTDPETKKRRKDLRPWPHNVLRHSAISYRVAQERDLARIAYESGNSPSVIQRHYNGLASPDAAMKFFSITPTEPANVRNFKAA